MMLGMLIFFFICMAIEMLGPILIEGLGLLTIFAGRCLATLVGALLFGLLKALRWCLAQLIQLGKLIAMAAEFLFILCDELLRNPHGDEEDVRASPEDDDPYESANNVYEDACAVLGLLPGFKRSDFKTAYRRAISGAHPDKGGSEESARTINLARDAIRAHHRW